MTAPCYPSGCAAESQVGGRAHGLSGCAWNVNLNNGNSNRNNHNNEGFVRAVRAGECHATVSFRDLHAAWRAARRGKVPSHDQLGFDVRWIDRLYELQARLNDLSWRPSPPTCFIAAAPKAREIHAPAFADRVVQQ